MCGQCLCVCANLTRVNGFLVEGGKMKLNDSKKSFLNFLLRIKKKVGFTPLSFPSLAPTVETFNLIKSSTHQLSSYWRSDIVLGIEEAR